MEDDPINDPDYVNFEWEYGVKRQDMGKFRHAINYGIRRQLSDADIMMMMNFTLFGVDRDDKYVSKSLIRSWRKELADEAKKDYEAEHQNVKCITFDGKTVDESIGHNQTERNHQLTFVVEPEMKYLEHAKCGETGIAMCMATMNVIEETNSLDSLLAIGAGKTILKFHITLL